MKIGVVEEFVSFLQNSKLSDILGSYKLIKNIELYNEDSAHGYCSFR